MPSNFPVSIARDSGLVIQSISEKNPVIATVELKMFLFHLVEYRSCPVFSLIRSIRLAHVELLQVNLSLQPSKLAARL